MKTNGGSKRVCRLIWSVLFFIFVYYPFYIVAQDNRQPIRIIQKNSEGQIVFMIEYKLDNAGRKVSGIEHMGEKDFPLVFTYDRNGRLIREKKGNEREGDVVEITEYTYNSEGRISKKLHYFVYPDGEKIIIEELKYRYDAPGNLVYESSVSSGLETIKEYRYDESGKKIGGVIRGGEKGLMAEIEYRYTEKGLLREVISKQPGGPGGNNEILWKETYQYDENGKLIREEHRFGRDVNQPPIVKTYQYDENGQKIKETYLVGDQVRLEVLYEY